MPWAGIVLRVCVCVCVRGAGRWGHSPTSFLLKAQMIFVFCIPSQLVTHAVTLSVTSRCVTQEQLWSGLPGWANNKSGREHSAGERGSHSSLRPPYSFSYSRVQFSESYLGIILIPHPAFFPLRARKLRLPVWTLDQASCWSLKLSSAVQFVATPCVARDGNNGRFEDSE